MTTAVESSTITRSLRWRPTAADMCKVCSTRDSPRVIVNDSGAHCAPCLLRKLYMETLRGSRCDTCAQMSSRILWVNILGEGERTRIVLSRPNVGWASDVAVLESAVTIMADRGIAAIDVKAFRFQWTFLKLASEWEESRRSFGEAGPAIRYAIHTTGRATCYECCLAVLKQRLLATADLQSPNPATRAQELVEIFSRARVLADQTWSAGWPD
jgi:hypothetical protein